MVSGTRASGGAYLRPSTLPVNQLGIGQIMVSSALSEADMAREVKRKVLASLLEGGGIVGSGGRQTLMEISGEAYQLDRDGEWTISSLSTEVNGEGEVTNETRMREVGVPSQCRRLSTLPRSDSGRGL